MRDEVHATSCSWPWTWSWTCSRDHELELDLEAFQLTWRCTDFQLALSVDKARRRTPSMSWKHNTKVLANFQRETKKKDADPSQPHRNVILHTYTFVLKHQVTGHGKSSVFGRLTIWPQLLENFWGRMTWVTTKFPIDALAFFIQKIDSLKSGFRGAALAEFE